MLDGRVKTLHPRIHGGLLGAPRHAEHMAALAAHGIEPIDLLVINLYPFAQTVARADCTLEDAIENIDIGGPAMLRAAAKNWQRRRRGDRSRRLSAECSPSSTPAGVTRATQVRVGQEGVRAHRGLRRHDRQLPRARWHPAPKRTARRCQRARPTRRCSACRWPRRRPALRREPAPERRLLPRPRRSAWHARARRAAAGQGAQLQQHRRRRCRLGMREDLRRSPPA